MSTNSLFCLSEAGSPPLVVLWSLIEGGGACCGEFLCFVLVPEGTGAAAAGEVHVHVRRYPIASVPEDNADQGGQPLAIGILFC